MAEFFSQVPLPAGRYPAGAALFRSYDPLLDGDPTPHLVALAEAGVSFVINLMEEREQARRGGAWREAIAEFYAGHGLREERHPLRDFAQAPPARLARIVRRLDGLLREGQKVVIHCHHGVGRTGAVLEAFLAPGGGGGPLPS